MIIFKLMDLVGKANPNIAGNGRVSRKLARNPMAAHSLVQLRQFLWRGIARGQARELIFISLDFDCADRLKHCPHDLLSLGQVIQASRRIDVQGKEDRALM